MSVQRGGDLSAHINSYLEEEQSRNKTQGENGVYHGYAYESLDVVYNIIKTEGIALSEELLNSIINVSLDTLASQAQTIRAKLSAVKLLQFVYFQYNEKAANWKDVKRQMLENSAVFSVGSEMGAFSEDKNVILSFQYDLFLCCLQEPNQVFLRHQKRQSRLSTRHFAPHSEKEAEKLQSKKRKLFFLNSSQTPVKGVFSGRFRLLNLSKK